MNSNYRKSKNNISADIINQAMIVNQKGKTDDAIKLLLKAIAYFPTEQDTYHALAEILLNSKKYEDAIQILNELPTTKPGSRELELMGYCKEGLRLYKEAKDFANRALLLNGKSAPALNLSGLIEYNMGEISRAMAFFKKAVEADPEYGEPYTNIGLLYWEKDRDEALSMFEKGFILTPVVTKVASTYHYAASELGIFDRAEKVFRNSSALNPNNKMIRYLYIDLLIKQEKYTNAMQQIENAIVSFGVQDGILSSAQKIRDLLKKNDSTIIREHKNSVSLCMIVKNEENHLAKCLNSVKPLVSEIIIVDTGSTDQTKEVAEVFGAKVFNYKWTNDFSKARNYSISKATGKWILILDADETISSLDYNDFNQVIETAGDNSYQFTTRNYTFLLNMIGWSPNDGKYQDNEAGLGWTPSNKVRLFPNTPEVRFEYPVHELIEPSLEKVGLEVKYCPIPIHHYGKLNQEEVDKKDDKYYQIGRSKLNGLKDNANAIRELAIQAGVLGKYDESIELWKRFIKMRPGNPNALVNLGAMYTKIGKYDKAVLATEKALDTGTDMKEAHYNYAFSKLHLGHVKEVILILEKPLNRLSDYPPAKFLLAVAYCLEGSEKKWKEIFKELHFKMKSGLATACHLFAKGLVSAKKPDYAISLLEAAIESKNINKDIVDLYFNQYFPKGFQCNTS